MATEGQKTRILVVDDEPDVRDGIVTLLELEGFEVGSARDGSHALSTIKAQDRDSRPALVLVDLIMPGMNGLRFCQEMKHDPELSHIPLLLVSATVNEGAFSTCGAEAQLRKPLEPDELIRTVRRVLDERAAAATAARSGSGRQSARRAPAPEPGRGATT